MKLLAKPNYHLYTSAVILNILNIFNNRLTNQNQALIQCKTKFHMHDCICIIKQPKTGIAHDYVRKQKLIQAIYQIQQIIFLQIYIIFDLM